MPGVGPAPGGAVAMEDVRDLQPRAAHAAGLRSGSRRPLGQWCEPVERAGHATDRAVGDAGVKGRGVELGVAEQHLDDADVGVLLQQVRGEAVPQRMRRYPLFDPGRLGGGVDGAVELGSRAARPGCAPGTASRAVATRRAAGTSILTVCRSRQSQRHGRHFERRQD
jgi:hypothetical protein